MTLSEQIAGLEESSDESLQPEARKALEKIVVGTVPREISAAEVEIRRLKFEAAIAKVDAELETAKQECMIRYRGTLREPTMGQAWGSLIGGIAFVGFFLWLGVKGREEVPPLSFIGFGAAIWLAYIMVTSTREEYLKSRQLQAAKSQWARARRLLIESQHP